MMRKNSTVPLIIACFLFPLASAANFSKETMASITPTGDKPWSFGSDWQFTWEIDTAPSPFMDDTRLRFTVNSTNIEVNQEEVASWNIKGSISRYVDFGSGIQWTLMKENIAVASFIPSLNQYSITVDGSADNILFIPNEFEEPMLWFKNGYDAVDSSNWSISINETSRSFVAVNKTNDNHTLSIQFNKKGAVKEFTRTTLDGSVSFHMILLNQEYLGYDFQSLLIILLSVVAGISILGAYILFTKRTRGKQLEDLA
ncbi:hypothetical protein GF325_09755 [Candidatus Bathyarchaeota archaeon]|nr:hypothetical protein [Candidatus Bathyarchaeota archaeon]